VLAEEVWADLDREQSNAKRHQPTIEMLKFAAKRIDYLGMKAQFAKEIADFYREARSQMGNRSLVSRNLHEITSTNGRLQDLRDAINELKASYRERWLSENRPYWLDNVLVNYEYEALNWRQRARQFVEVRQQYAQSQELPDAETLGWCSRKSSLGLTRGFGSRSDHRFSPPRAPVHVLVDQFGGERHRHVFEFRAELRILGRRQRAGDVRFAEARNLA